MSLPSPLHGGVSIPESGGDGAPDAPPRIGIAVQGPIYTDAKGNSTREVFEMLRNSPLRSRFYVVYAVWDDETHSDLLGQIAPLADKIVRCRKPERSGSCHRNYQAHATSDALAEIARQGIPFALKTRSDLVLSDRFLETLLSRAEMPGYEKILVTNLFTRVEPFHISDLAVFSTTENLRLWFAPASVFYEDAFSPEVQFARVFVRSRRLKYAMTLDGYFRFLSDWVDLVDFFEQDLRWFKDIYGSIRAHNRKNFVMLDRDGGPVLSRLLSVRFHRFLQGKAHGLTLLATIILVHDAVQRYLVLTIPKTQHWHYTVDNKGAEHAKRISGAADRVADLENSRELAPPPRNGHGGALYTETGDAAVAGAARGNGVAVQKSGSGT